MSGPWAASMDDFSEFLPKSPGDLQRIDIQVVLPCRLIACLMQLSMMAATKRDLVQSPRTSDKGQRSAVRRVFLKPGLVFAHQLGSFGNLLAS